MVNMASHLKGDYLPYQLSFSGALSEITRLLITLPVFSGQDAGRAQNVV